MLRVMPWLVSEARVLASADVARSRRAKRRGLLRRDGFEGALVLDGCHWVHTIGMRFDLDVAYVGGDGVVLKTVRMPRYRIGAPVRRARWVIEAEAGAFERWGLQPGDPVELRVEDAQGESKPSRDGRAGPAEADGSAGSAAPADPAGGSVNGRGQDRSVAAGDP